MHEQHMYQLRITELGLTQREPDPVHGVIGKPPRLPQGLSLIHI